MHLKTKHTSHQVHLSAANALMITQRRYTDIANRHNKQWWVIHNFKVCHVKLLPGKCLFPHLHSSRDHHYFQNTVVFRGISNFCKVAKHLYVTVYINIFWLWHRTLTRSKSWFFCTQTLCRYLLSRLPINQQSRENVRNGYIISSRAVATTPVLNHRRNTPSARVPALTALIVGSLFLFAQFPTPARVLLSRGLSGGSSKPSAHCSRQPLKPPLINCN